MNQRTRNDGLMDVIRGYASATQSYGYQGHGGHFLPHVLYETDGLAQIIVDRPAEDAVSRGFKIEGDPDDVVLNELDRLNAFQQIIDAMRWSRLEGASAILLLTEDGADLGEPLDPSRVRAVEDLIVYQKNAISPDVEYYDDPRQRTYGLPLRYRLVPPYGGEPFYAHDTRLLKFTGEPVPPSRRVGQHLWWEGRSVLDGCRRDLERYRAGLWLSERILERKQQAIHAMQGLSELLASEEGKSMVREKIALTDSVRGLLNSITIDNGPGNGTANAGDDYKIIDLSLSGIDALLNALKIALCASSGFPAPILFGEDLRGLGSVGTGEMTIYHSRVKALQERNVRPALETLAPLLWSQPAVQMSEPSFWRLDFVPLLAPSAAEEADVEVKKATARKTSAEAVAVALDSGTISPEEGRDLLRETTFESLPKGPPPEPEELPGSPDAA